MTTILLLTKEDISTTPAGLNINVKTKDGIVLNFTQDAAEEMINDLNFTLKFIREGRGPKEWPGNYDECDVCDGVGSKGLGVTCDKCNGEGRILKPNI